MPRNRLLVATVIIPVVAILLVALAPMLVSRGVLLWIWWNTRHSQLTVQIESIDAPLLGPVSLNGVRLQTASTAAARVNVGATRVVFGLNLRSMLLRTRGRTLRHLSVAGLHAELFRNRAGAVFSESAWNTLQRLLPQTFDIQSADFRVQDGPTLLLLRNVSVTGSSVEAGRFRAGEVMLSSPLFRQTFVNLQGSTDWEGERLRIAGLTLSRGLDVQSITLDLSHLGKRRIGVDFDVDAFGGKLRGSMADEWRSPHPNWNLAGSANDISLLQTAEAFGFTDKVGGVVHAGKFTFRGDPNDALAGTASLWMELAKPAWRDRAADVIMLGLSLYGRQVELQQLYIKQKNNELTLNGQSSFPTTAAGWLRPDFRGTVSAAIDDLGEFASLLGARPEHFAGRVEVNGTLNARERNVGGNLVANGSGLTMFQSSIDQFHCELGLSPDDIRIAQLELKRGNDMLRAQGNIETSPDHPYSGTIDAVIADLANYSNLVNTILPATPVTGRLHADISGGVWEAQATIDPPQSRPIDIRATFPLPINQPAAALWDSNVTITADVPGLYLAETPASVLPAVFQSGMLTAQVTITSSLHHPNIVGFAQLSGGRTHGREFDARVRFDGGQAVVERISIGGKDNGASFYGNLDMRDAENLRLQMVPNQPVYNVTAPLLDCINRVDVAPAAVPPLGFPVGIIDLIGPVNSLDWRLDIREPVLGGAADAMLSQPIASYRFCTTGSTYERPLLLQVAAPQPPISPTPPPRRGKRKR